MSVTNANLKSYLRMPTAANAELDAVLDAALAAAEERIAVILEVPDLTNIDFDAVDLAVKFLAAFYFQNPDATEDALKSALNAVSLLLSNHRSYSFPTDAA